MNKHWMRKWFAGLLLSCVTCVYAAAEKAEPVRCDPTEGRFDVLAGAEGFIVPPEYSRRLSSVGFIYNVRTGGTETASRSMKGAYLLPPSTLSRTPVATSPLKTYASDVRGMVKNKSCL